MYGGIAKRLGFSWPVLRRPLWVLVAAAHIPALINSWTSFVTAGFAAEQLGGCVALTATMLFFVLKFVDVHALRLRSDRRSWVAIGLVVLLLHVGAFDARVDAAITPASITVAMATLLVAGLARVSCVFSTALRRCAATLKSGSRLVRSNETAWSDPFRPHCWVLALRLFTLRAPPA